jgi:hypothetical protein
VMASIARLANIERTIPAGAYVFLTYMLS